MAHELWGVLGILAFLLLVALRVPLAFGFLLVGTFGSFYLAGFSATMHILVGTSVSWAANFLMLSIPLYILMGTFAFHGGISRDLFAVTRKLMGGLPGGLAMATIGGCGGFAACSASSLATAAAMGKVTYPEMRAYNYSPRLSAGCIAAGGELGTLIPPSNLFIIYALITDTSIGKLFMAGVLPGIMMVSLYILVIYIWVTMNPSLAPRAPSVPWKERLSLLPRLGPAALLVITVLGGIYGGVFTPSEAAAVGSLVAFLYVVATRRLSWQIMKDSLLETASITGMIFLLIIGALVFNVFVALSGLPSEIAGWLIRANMPGFSGIIVLLLLYLFLGCFMDAVGMVLLTMPFFLPVFQISGVNLIWLGVLVVRLMEIASITPPYGLNVFVVAGVAKDVPINTIFRGVAPFLIADIIGTALLVAFPQISLFLPNSMMR